MKQLSNKQWLDIVLAKHKPVSRDIGSQRDPEIIVQCSCTAYIPTKLRDPREPTWIDYPHHLISILEQEFPNLFSERE